MAINNPLADSDPICRRAHWLDLVMKYTAGTAAVVYILVAISVFVVTGQLDPAQWIWLQQTKSAASTDAAMIHVHTRLLNLDGPGIV